MDATMLDGNAIAGLLQEVFAAEVTTAICTCRGCGASEPIGAVRVFVGAGTVLRCPHCETVLVTIARIGERLSLTFRGVESLELTP
jgi:hypothetical protein